MTNDNNANYKKNEFGPIWEKYEHYFATHKSYYDIKVEISQLFDEQNGSENSCSFIDEHFNEGKKSPVFELPFRDEYEELGKHVHTVSLYLMGLYVQDLFEDKIRLSLSKFIQDVSWHDFKHTWFLTSLYHDVGSCVENHGIKNKDGSFRRVLDHHLKPDEKKFSIYNHRLHSGKRFKHRFNKKTINNYFRYRAANFSCEHGIIGGNILFSKLSEILKGVLEGSNCTGSNLTWKKEHFDLFAYIADAIICHNVWLNGPEAVYEHFGLANLLVKKNPKAKLSLDRYPLQFLLCLLDTIEPIKKFSGMSPRDVLLNIFIKYDSEENFNNKLRISIGWTQDIREHKNFLTWLNAIKNMEDWMDVKVSLKKEEICLASRENYYLEIEIDESEEPEPIEAMQSNNNNLEKNNMDEPELLDLQSLDEQFMSILTAGGPQ